MGETVSYLFKNMLDEGGEADYQRMVNAYSRDIIRMRYDLENEYLKHGQKSKKIQSLSDELSQKYKEFEKFVMENKPKSHDDNDRK